jgi:hypothetical protein
MPMSIEGIKKCEEGQRLKDSGMLQGEAFKKLRLSSATYYKWKKMLKQQTPDGSQKPRPYKKNIRITEIPVISQSKVFTFYGDPSAIADLVRSLL